ncbi:MAG: polymer-forming cytoskeletal protein [Saprospiraceae bacterium]|nr:polymer-forming cytoskeletal protein [Saprospiraceae bacterium]MBK8450585.1 polymer-forming cytoskeletal protein [Saprospiraceae bacterium]MBK8485336.1 polymer-forming cytoskeletal protein [Saprospiraceae bacterium]MBK9222555.1 polymer-forming cytoskeletal protein [Saprospiraceae bacterium]MBK9720412.1 polymer-forming cytoskeletal protein [Saprospiraceae bacterium]
MFGNKNSVNEAAKSAAGPLPQGALNSLVVGTQVEGTITAESDIRIDGFLKGILLCKGKVIIGPKGTIEGEIRAQNATIEGRFKGILQIEDLLQVKETAIVEGEINTDKLAVSPGAKFNVTSKMTTNPRSNTPPIMKPETIKM